MLRWVDSVTGRTLTRYSPRRRRPALTADARIAPTKWRIRGSLPKVLPAVRPVFLAGLVLVEQSMTSTALVVAALYVALACAAEGYPAKGRGTRSAITGVFILADIVWLVIAIDHFGFIPVLLPFGYAVAAGVVAACVSWTLGIEVPLLATIIYYCAALVYCSVMNQVLAGEATVYLAAALTLAGGLLGYVGGEVYRLDRSRRAHDRLRLLSSADSEMAEAEGDGELFVTISTAAANIAEASRVWLMRVDDETGMMHLETRARDSRKLYSARSVSATEGIAGEAVLKGRGLIINDAAPRSRRLSDFEQQFADHHVIAVPIPDVDGTIGVILATRKRSQPGFTTTELDLLTVLASAGGAKLQTARLLRRLQVSATRDSLTGLYNHGTFLEELQRQIEQTAARNDHFSLIVLDMDKFKQINDTEGHIEGDRVLMALARKLQDHFRLTDFIARCGGDEFAVLLPGMKREDALPIADRAAAAMEQIGKDLRLRTPTTASWGIASFPDDARTDKELYRKADARLYIAKRAGGGRLESAGDASSPPDESRDMSRAPVSLEPTDSADGTPAVRSAG